MSPDRTISTIERALDELLAHDVPPADAADATALIRRTEHLARRLRAVQQHQYRVVEESGVHSADGYASTKAMTRRVARLSHRAAAARTRGARMQADLPEVWAGLCGGTLGIDQFDLLARVHANPRVRDAMADAQAWFLRRAVRLSFADFEAEVRRWERLADADGPEPKNSANHDNRNATLLQDPVDLGWQLSGGFGALQGASIDDIFRHYADAERLADWEKARAEHGDDAHAGQLPRTEPQRRAEALWKVFQDAAGAAASPVGVEFVHTIVWDAATFEETMRRLSGEEPQPLDPETAICRTIDGTALEPIEAGANALVRMFRRAVVDGAGVTIDLGRARRFTGGARLAVQLNDEHCPWPGCRVPISSCEIDHTTDHARGGRTHPGNGGPLCGKHNRWKQKGFSIWRDPTGAWHIYRPDGTEVG